MEKTITLSIKEYEELLENEKRFERLKQEGNCLVITEHYSQYHSSKHYSFGYSLQQLVAQFETKSKRLEEKNRELEFQIYQANKRVSKFFNWSVASIILSIILIINIMMK